MTNLLSGLNGVMKNSKFYPGNWPTWLKVVSLPFIAVLAIAVGPFMFIYQLVSIAYLMLFDGEDAVFKKTNHD